MATYIGRREFILGSAAAACPLAARAQQPTLPVIGFISAGSRDTYAVLLAAFRQGLKETGYIEGQTVAIESRWADGQLDRLPRLAADLVQRRVAVIVTTGGSSSSRAAMAASGTIPIVFLSQSDPINSGFVTSFNRPDGNATGMALLTGPLVAKRLEIVLQLAPAGAPIGYLMNPQDTREAGDYLREAQAAAQAIGQRLIIVNAGRQHDMAAAFAALVDQRAGALIVSTTSSCCAIKSSHWRHAIAFPRSTIGASLLQPGDSSPTERTWPTPIARSACTPAVSSKVRNRPTSRCCSRPSSSWSSISA
jgi:putative ABC transport system substrate-binding protein